MPADSPRVSHAPPARSSVLAPERDPISGRLSRDGQDAKNRQPETRTSRAAPRAVRPRWLLPVAIAVPAVVVIVGIVALTSGGDDDTGRITSPTDGGVATNPVADSTASTGGPEDSQPAVTPLTDTTLPPPTTSAPTAVSDFPSAFTATFVVTAFEYGDANGTPPSTREDLPISCEGDVCTLPYAATYGVEVNFPRAADTITIDEPFSDPLEDCDFTGFIRVRLTRQPDGGFVGEVQRDADELRFSSPNGSICTTGRTTYSAVLTPA